jgi:hypothetical protein
MVLLELFFSPDEGIELVVRDEDGGSAAGITIIFVRCCIEAFVGSSIV